MDDALVPRPPSRVSLLTKVIVFVLLGHIVTIAGSVVTWHMPEDFVQPKRLLVQTVQVRDSKRSPRLALPGLPDSTLIAQLEPQALPTPEVPSEAAEEFKSESSTDFALEPIVAAAPEPKPEPKPEPAKAEPSPEPAAPPVEEKTPEPKTEHAKPKQITKVEKAKPKLEPEPEKKKNPLAKVPPKAKEPQSKAAKAEQVAKDLAKEKRAAKETKEAAVKKQKEKQRKEAAAAKQKQLLDKVKESIAKIDQSDHKDSYGQAISVPQSIGKLHIEAPTSSRGDSRGGGGDPGGAQSEEVQYSDELVQRLKLVLRLPEYGRVKVRLVIKRDGRVVRVEVISSQSEKNRKYVEERLTHVTFPNFGSHFAGQQEKTFPLTLSNDL